MYGRVFSLSSRKAHESAVRNRGVAIPPALLCAALSAPAWPKPAAMMISLALFRPDQAGNVGTLARTAACFGVPLHIIEPCGFPFSLAVLRRSAMDYLERAELHRHADWEAFVGQLPGRLILLTTQASTPLHAFPFAATDTLLLGQESAGAPEFVHARADARLHIPLRPPARSLNIAVAGGIALAQALHSTGQLR